jgi:transposase
MTMTELKESHKAQQRQIDSLLNEITYLKQENEQLRRFIFGQKRERFVPTVPDEQLGLDLGDMSVETEISTQQISYQRKKVNVKRAGQARNPLPAHLERRDTIIEPQEDTSGLSKIGEEITEELEYEPGNLYVNRFIRPKYAKTHEDSANILIGDLPLRPIEKGIAGPGLLAHILISKFVDHLPIYRQLQIFKRQDVRLSKSTIDGWVSAVCDLLSPLYESIKKQILQSDYLMVDETTIRVLDKMLKGRTHQGYFWVYYDPLGRQVLFEYCQGRGREGPNEMLKTFTGAIQTDGYAGYNEVNARSDITELACMAHARRYFEKALDQDKERAGWMTKHIQVLYKIEAKARDEGLSYEQRFLLRKEQSAPVLKEMKKWLDENLTEVLPSSLPGKAIGYMLKRWPALNRYIDDGRYEIDNNLVENAIRPVALGRKNYLFAGSHNGAKRAAMIYSLAATAKMQGLEPQAYLKNVLTKLPDWPHRRIEDLLPQNLKNSVKLSS